MADYNPYSPYPQFDVGDSFNKLLRLMSYFDQKKIQEQELELERQRNKMQMLNMLGHNPAFWNPDFLRRMLENQGFNPQEIENLRNYLSGLQEEQKRQQRFQILTGLPSTAYSQPEVLQEIGKELGINFQSRNYTIPEHILNAYAKHYKLTPQQIEDVRKQVKEGNPYVIDDIQQFQRYKYSYRPSAPSTPSSNTRQENQEKTKLMNSINLLAKSIEGLWGKYRESIIREDFTDKRAQNLFFKNLETFAKIYDRLDDVGKLYAESTLAYSLMREFYKPKGSPKNEIQQPQVSIPENFIFVGYDKQNNPIFKDKKTGDYYRLQR